MSTNQMNKLIQTLHKVLLGQDAATMTDGQLLDYFVSRRDEVALDTLVRRHGPIIWGVCHRVLRNHHDAEDAFQATFLVLVRKAASIVPREMVGNWLYGVANQTALKARDTSAKRQSRERQMANLPETAATDQNLWQDLKPMLDQELRNLPAKYRAVILLCDLDGMTRKEAARQLGCPEGTVAGRLAQARAMLAKRLARHGFAVTGGSLATILAQDAAASVPASVLSATIKTAVLVAASQGAMTSAVSSKVAVLTNGVVNAMMMTKVKKATIAVLAFGLIAMGGTLLSYQIAVEPTKSLEPDEPKQKPLPQAEREQSDEQKITFAVQNMKRNLDGISHFTCRYSVNYCNAPTLEDAMLDRNVERKTSLHVSWIVKKPVERFLVVKDKELLDEPISRLKAPRGKRGPIDAGGKGVYYPKVYTNYLWDGALLLGVSDIGVAAIDLGFRGGSHPRGPGTPLEGEAFYYTDPDRYLKNDKDRQVTLSGISPSGLWQFHFGPAGERPQSKTALDPKRGFLPVRASHWVEFHNGKELTEGYSDWYATHFQKVGNDSWITIRSFHDVTHVVTKKDPEKPRIYFREFKVERFDADKMVNEEDLAITIPSGHQVQAHQVEWSKWALFRTSEDRLVSHDKLPQLWKELEKSAEYWKSRAR